LTHGGGNRHESSFPLIACLKQRNVEYISPYGVFPDCLRFIPAFGFGLPGADKMARIPTLTNKNHRGEYRLDRFDRDSITYLGFEYVKDKRTLANRRSSYLSQGKKIWLFYIDASGNMKRLKNKYLDVH